MSGIKTTAFAFGGRRAGARHQQQHRRIPVSPIGAPVPTVVSPPTSDVLLGGSVDPEPYDDGGPICDPLTRQAWVFVVVMLLIGAAGIVLPVVYEAVISTGVDNDNTLIFVDTRNGQLINRDVAVERDAMNHLVRYRGPASPIHPTDPRPPDPMLYLKRAADPVELHRARVAASGTQSTTRLTTQSATRSTHTPSATPSTSPSEHVAAAVVATPTNCTPGEEPNPYGSGVPRSPAEQMIMDRDGTAGAIPGTPCVSTTHNKHSFNESLIDHTGVSPCVDFFAYACGPWVAANPGRSRGFGGARDLNTARILSIIRAPLPAIDPPNDLHVFWSSCQRTMEAGQSSGHAAEELGRVLRHVLQPLENAMDPGLDGGRARGVATTRTLVSQALGRFTRYGFGGWMDMSVETNPSSGRLSLCWTPSVLPSRFDDPTHMASVMATISASPVAITGAYRIHQALTQASRDLIRSVRQFYASGSGVRTYVAGGGLSRDVWNLGDAESRLEMDLPAFLDAMGFQHDQNTPLWFLSGLGGGGSGNAGPTYARTLSMNISAFNLDEWRAYLSLLIVHNMRDFIPRLQNSILFRAAPVVGPTLDFCAHVTADMLPGQLGAAYVTRYFPHNTVRDRVVRQVEDIRDESARLLEETTWLSPGARKTAADKIRQAVVRAVHPSSFEPEQFPFTSPTTGKVGPPMSPHNYPRNLIQVRRLRVHRQRAQWNAYRDSDTGSPAVRDALSPFSMPLHVVNAFYQPERDTITLLPGILLPPFYSPVYDDVSNQAGLGMVAGHEFLHGNDKDGHYYGASGRLGGNTWTAHDERAFEAHGDCIAAGYTAPPVCNYNASVAGYRSYGHQVLGEAAADLGGLRAAYGVFVRNSGGRPSLKRRRRFWLAFAQNFCESRTVEATCSQVLEDPHPVGRERILNTLRQMPEFARDYGCLVGGQSMSPGRTCPLFGPTMANVFIK